MLILLDADGVLVHNRAYRAGIRETVAYFAGRLGLAAPAPTDGDVDVFESQSIIVEWDTCAILTAALLLERLRAEPGDAHNLPADFWQALEALPPVSHPRQVAMNYADIARRVGGAARPGTSPSRVALGLFLEDVRAAGGLPVGAVAPVLASILGSAYQIEQSPGMQ